MEGLKGIWAARSILRASGRDSGGTTDARTSAWLATAERGEEDCQSTPTLGSQG